MLYEKSRVYDIIISKSYKYLGLIILQKWEINGDYIH